MRKFGSIVLLSVYAISLVQVMVPVLSFHFNHEYVKTHLCRSLFEYGYDDCDGFCYLKKQVEQHHGHDHDHQHMPEATPPKVPLLYVLKLIHDEYPSKPNIPEEPFLAIHDRSAHQFYADVILPPPKA